MDPHAVRTQRDEVLWLAKSVSTTLNPKVDPTDSSALQNALGLPIRIALPPERANRSIDLVPVARQTYPNPGETNGGLARQILDASYRSSSSSSSSSAKPTIPPPFFISPNSLPWLRIRSPKAFRAAAFDATSQTWTLALLPAAARVRGVSGSGDQRAVKIFP